jgi:hypothetical protein
MKYEFSTNFDRKHEETNAESKLEETKSEKDEDSDIEMEYSVV